MGMNMAATIAIAAIATLTPTVTCIIAYLLSRQDVRRLEDKVDALRDSTNQRFEAMNFRFEGRFDELKESAHKDSLLILRSMTDLHERVAKVEARQER